MMRLTEADLIPGQNVKQLRCSICSEIFLDPVFFEGKCQCVFCRNCITSGLQAKSKCPVCETEVTANALKPHLWVQNALQALQVPCPNKCLWIGPNDSRCAHLMECPVPRLTKEFADIEKRLQVNDERQLDLKRELACLQEEKNRLDQQKEALRQETYAKTQLTFPASPSEDLTPRSNPPPNPNEVPNMMGKGTNSMNMTPVPASPQGKMWADPMACGNKGGPKGMMPMPMMGCGPMMGGWGPMGMKGGKGGPWMGCPQVGPMGPTAPMGPMGPMVAPPCSGLFFDPTEPLTPANLAKVPFPVQKQVIGDKIFPVAARTYPSLAAKITYIILEMDNSDILPLLNSEFSLNNKVEEVVRMLGLRVGPAPEQHVAESHQPA
mmetsp:Transcript_34201/g.72830  ORF Transcript_34201/g.72830 Transcript_34201/m.72830 type:complete len:379 (-) Transcript_34201:292-1428(-)